MDYICSLTFHYYEQLSFILAINRPDTYQSPELLLDPIARSDVGSMYMLVGF